MRDYSKISPLFWVGETGRRIRESGKDCQVLSLYLLSGPSANMIGLYYLPLASMTHETGLSKPACQRALHRLAELGFSQWDPATETVFVFEMAAHQIGEPLRATDNRCKGIEKEWEALRRSPFHSSFHARYAASFHLPKVKNGRPLRAPSKPLRSQEQEQEQEQSSDQEGANQGPNQNLSASGSSSGASADVILLGARRA